MQLILAFSQIVGVSCDGHVGKLKAVIAAILADTASKAAKKAWGSSSW